MNGLQDTWWYRYIAFDAVRVGTARVVKNTIFGIGTTGETGFIIWFPQSNEKVGITYDDVQTLIANSRAFNGKIQGEHVPAGVDNPTIILRRSTMDGGGSSRRPTEGKEQKSAPIKQRDTSPTNETGQETTDRTSTSHDRELDESIREKIQNAKEVFGARELHWYGCVFRPAGFGATPNDHVALLTPEEAARKFPTAKSRDIRHGAVAYGHELSAKEVANFELSILLEIDASSVESRTYIKELAEFLAARTAAKIISSKRGDHIPVITADDIALHVSTFKRNPIVHQKFLQRHPDMLGSASRKAYCEAMANFITSEQFNEALNAYEGMDQSELVDTHPKSYWKVLYQSTGGKAVSDLPFNPSSLTRKAINFIAEAINEIYAGTRFTKLYIAAEKAKIAVWSKGTYEEIENVDKLSTEVDSLNDAEVEELRRSIVASAKQLGFDYYVDNSQSVDKEAIMKDIMFSACFYIAAQPKDNAVNFATLMPVLDRITRQPMIEFTEITAHSKLMKTITGSDYAQYKKVFSAFNIQLMSVSYIKECLVEWKAEHETVVIEPEAFEDKKKKFEYEIVRDGMIPNNPRENQFVSPHPLKFKPLDSRITFAGETIEPCRDPELIEMMNQLEALVGNRIKMGLNHLRWGIGSSTFMGRRAYGAYQILSISPEQLRKLYGRLDLTVLGSAVTHEMGHYCLDHIIKQSDLRKFKREAAAVRLHSEQSTASGSPYPFYHEQFAMLCEYGLWGTCIRGLQSTKGFDIVNKYFAIDQYVTDEIRKSHP